MTKSSTVLKFFKMKFLKKNSGLVPQVSTSGLAAPKTTTPTEPSGVTTQSKLYKITQKLSSKTPKPSTAEFSSQSPSGAFESGTATKTASTATTTTNGTGSKPPAGQASHRFPGLFNLDHPAKKTKQLFAKIVVPLRSAQKEGKYSTQCVPTDTVDQSVNTEEVGAINNTSANHSELASGLRSENEFFQEEFPLATQTQEVEGESTKGSTFPEIATAQDTALKCATANGSTTKTPNDRSGSKIKRYLKRLSISKRSIPKVSRKGRGTSSPEGSLDDHTDAKGHRSRKGSWWKRSTVSKINQSVATSKVFWKTEETSEDGFCRVVLRKLHMDWATRKVGMAANSSCSETSSDLGGESTEEMESAEDLESTEESQDETDEAEDTDDTDDTESIETFNGVGETQVVVMSMGEEELQEREESGCEVAGDSTQIPPKSFSDVSPTLQLSDLSHTLEHDVQIEAQASLEPESDPSPYATQELICRVMERFGKPYDDSLTSTETTFLNERGLSSFLPDTERKKQNSRPVSNARNLNEIMGLDIEEECSPIERPQINQEKHFRTRKFTLAPSNPTQGFMKELQLVERRSGLLDAERLESVPKTTEGVQEETENAEESMVQSVASISESETPFKRPECGSLVRRSTGFTLDVIERNMETVNETTIHQEPSYLDRKDSKELEDGDCDRMALGLGSSPIAPHETLWHFLGLTGREDWQRIRDDFIQGEDLHINCEAKTSLSSLPEMGSSMIQQANLGDNNDCEADSHSSQEVSFPPQSEVLSTQSAPSKRVLKKPMVTNTYDLEDLQPLEKPWTVEDRQTLAEEMLQRFIDCRATMVKFSGKLALAELKEPLDTFTSCFKFTLNKYVRVQKNQFSDYSHYLSEIQASVGIALSVLDSAGEQFCNLLDYISTTPKSPSSMLEVQEKASILMSSISTSAVYLQKAQKALAQVTPKDLEYARTMVDLFQKGIHSQTHICFTYKMFRLFFLPDPSEKEEANAVTGFCVFDDELYALHEPSRYADMAAFAEKLGTLQTCCDVVKKACEELEALTKEITAGLCKLNSGGSAVA
ncbi:hypothetical protein JCM33374_g426 [Metschnikowia sp. JCM 33374]|nr:hypothetical protein JCM33374_g426 [Metschnikowia sp. JCM 33374]